MRFRRPHATALEVYQARAALRATDAEIERLGARLYGEKNIEWREHKRLRENLRDLEYKRLRQRQDLAARGSTQPNAA